MLSNLIQATVLGIVQGLTEFIPVSSSGHLQIVPQLLGWQQGPDQLINTTFFLFLNAGTLLALVIYFRALIWRYLKVTISWITSKGNLKGKENLRDWKVILRVIVGFIPAALLGVILDNAIEHFYDNSGSVVPTLLTVGAMGIFGVIFLFADKLFTSKRVDLDKVGYGSILVIGFSQAVAFLRGVSRSGITLISGQAVGLTRLEAAEYSFLISIPISVGTTVLSVYHFIKEPASNISTFIIPDIVGVIFSFVFGYIAIRFMLNYLKNHGLAIFGWYRIIFAIICLIILV